MAYREIARARKIPLDYVVLSPKSADVVFVRVLQRATHGLKAEDVVRELHRQFVIWDHWSIMRSIPRRRPRMRQRT